MTPDGSNLTDITDVERVRLASGKSYFEFLRVDSMSAGVYALPAGSVIFVAAGVEHRFHDITEDLQVLVLFAPAETL